MDNSSLNIGFSSPPPPPHWKDLIRKPWFILLVTAIVLLGVGTFALNRVMIAVLHSRPEVAVPDLEGKGLNEALRISSEIGLSLHEEGTEPDESLPAGTILRQHPPSGMSVRAGRTIQVVISRGGQAMFVPGVIGKPVAEAQSLIQAERLQLGAVSSIYSTSMVEGSVVSQNPSSGTVVTRGALIDIEVSKGFPPAGAPTVPDFAGQPADKARDWASGVGVIVKLSEDAKAVGVAGTVVKQTPPAGQPLLDGEALRLVVVPLAAQSGERFRFQIPADKGQVTVKIMARDNRGESQIYKGAHKGGDTIELPMSVTSATRVRVYLDDILADEKVLEP